MSDPPYDPAASHSSASAARCKTWSVDRSAGTGADAAGAGLDALDDALERLADTAPEYAGGLANHGPMAAEALVVMGRADAVAPFVDRYRRALDPAPPRGRVLGRDQWAAALGAPDRFADFVATFERELQSRPVAEVVGEWVPRLSPGSIGAAGHGVIRTAHARRAVAAADTAARRRELAQGLAYWSATYTELPGPPALIGSGTVAAQLGALPHLGPQGSGGRLITDRVRHVDDHAEAFEAVVVGLAAPADPLIALDAVAAGGASAYVHNAAAGHAVALVHAVTIPMAFELLLDDVAVDERAGVFGYAWQAAAALHVCFAEDRGHVGEADLDTRLPYPEDLVDAAVASGDEHAVKLAEAALRAYRRGGDPVLLAAAADAAVRLR